MQRKSVMLTPAQRALLVPEVERVVLPNGLTVLLKADGAHPVVSMQLWVRSGSMHEGARLGSGLSHYLEHLVFKGTENWEGPALAQEAQGLGGTLNAYTTFDRTVYHLDGPAESLPRFAELLRELAFQPRLEESDMVEEKDVILREIDMGHDDPDHRITEAFFGTFYRRAPLRFPIIGHRELFRALTPEDVRSYHSERYGPGNAVLVIAGSFDAGASLAQVAELMATIPARSVGERLLTEEGPQLASREERLVGDFQLARVQVGYRIPAFHEADAPALDLLALVVGGGRSSILWQKLRDELGLVHEVEASSWNPLAPGIFGVSFLGDPARQAKAENALFETLSDLPEIDETAVARARQIAWRQEVNRRRTASGEASRLGTAETLVGDLGYAQAYWQRLLSVTPADLKKVARKYLVEDGRTLVALAPATGQKKPAGRREAGGLAPFDKETLPNGVRFLHQRDTTVPKIHLRVCGLGGSAVEQPGQRGVTQFLATLLTRDTLLRTAGQIASELDLLGASLNQFAGNNSFGLSLEVLSENFAETLGYLAEALQQPAFREETVAREREAQLADLAEDEDDVVTFAQRQLRVRFFGDHPLRLPPNGAEEDVRALDAAGVRSHAQKLLVGDNLVFSLAGDYRGRDLEAVRDLARTLPTGKIESLRPGSPEALADREVVLSQPREQAVVLLGLPDVGVADAQLVVGDLLQEIANDMGGVLFNEVREKRGLAYFVGASRVTGLGTGLFSLYAGTHPDHIAEVRLAFTTELIRWREGGITQAELHRAQRRLLAGRLLQHQLSGSRALEAALNELYRLGHRHGEGYRDRLEAVSCAEITLFAQTQLDPERSLALTVVPESTGH